MKYFSLLVVFIAISSKTYLQKSCVLEGIVGNYPIVMWIDEATDKSNSQQKTSATYFYKSNRHDIELEGVWKTNDILILTNTDEYDSTIYEQFILKYISPNNWSGTWKNKKGKLQAIVFQPIDTLKYTFNEVPELDNLKAEERIYTKTRLSFVKLTKDSTTQFGKYVLDWYTDEISKISLFRIKSGYDSSTIKKLNYILAKSQFNNIECFFNCNSNKGEGQWDYNIYDYFINKNIISIAASISSYCGGPYPSVGDDNLTIDAVTGKEIKDLDDIFWFTKQKPLKEEDKNYYDYTEKRGNIIFNILTKLYPNEMKKPKGEDCDYSRPDPWQYPSWYFKPEGLFIGASFPHVLQACANPEFAIIPYKLLLPYIVKGKEYLLQH